MTAPVGESSRRLDADSDLPVLREPRVPNDRGKAFRAICGPPPFVVNATLCAVTA